MTKEIPDYSKQPPQTISTKDEYEEAKGIRKFILFFKQPKNHQSINLKFYEQF